ncbi:MAG: hypothetical protein O9301_05065 [Leptospira sp.]|nr:hypothetical protein [Leptospira sp.]
MEPKENLEIKPNEELLIPAPIERSLRKGNINFDFLQPESGTKDESSPTSQDRRMSSRQGKRGMFNRGRTPRPFQKKHLYFAIGFAFLQVLLILMIALGKQYFWLLILPVLLTLLLGTFILVTLLLVRPL